MGPRSPPPQLENRKTVGSLAIHVGIPWKIAKLQSQHSMWAIIDRQRNAI